MYWSCYKLNFNGNKNEHSLYPNQEYLNKTGSIVFEKPHVRASQYSIILEILRAVLSHK